jgi:hypothetical protein
MTPKEKALELITNFRLFQSISYDEDGGYSKNYNVSRHNAKQCAIICVQEIMKANPIVPLEYMLESEALDKAREYWQSVKTEIEKL